MLNSFFNNGAAAAEAKEGIKSLRLNSADGAYLSRSSWGTFTDDEVYTFSMWIKHADAANGSDQYLLAKDGGGFAFFRGVGTLRWEGDGRINSTPKYYDNSGWMHILFVQSSGSSRELFVNGESVGTRSDSGNLSDSGALNIGADSSNANTFDGYIAEVYFVDGQALTVDDFTLYDSNGDLRPKDYTGTFGNQGFHLDFNDATSTGTIGDDSSGNGRDFTANNISVTAGAGNDSLLDSPSRNGTDTGAGGEVFGNYATLNPVDGAPSGLSNGNLDATSANAYPTLIPETGSWYYEVDGTGYTWDGTRANWTPRSGSHNFGQRPFSSTATSGYKALCSTNLAAPSFVKPETVVNTVLYTGTGSSMSITGVGFSPDIVWIKNRAASDVWLYDTVRGATKYVRTNSNNAEVTDANGLTSFDSDGFSLGTSHTSSGQSYVAWCWDAGSSTATNTDGTISSDVRASTANGFSVIKYTGNGTAGATVGHGLGAAPEFFMVKRFNAGTTDWAAYHVGMDATAPEDYYMAVNSRNSRTNSATRWNDTAPTSTVFTVGDDSSVNGSSDDYICYAWTSILGFSKFGSYTGNGSADGPFVNLGFRPAIVLIKRATGANNGEWTMQDSKRNGYNESNTNTGNESIDINNTNNENSQLVHFFANGFQCSQDDNQANDSGSTYIYAAWAEDPLKTALGR